MKAYHLFQKYGRLGLIVLSLLVMLIAYLVYNSKYKEYYPEEYQVAYNNNKVAVDLNDSKMKESLEILSADEANEKATDLSAGSAAGVGFVYTYILIVIAGLCAIILPILVTKGEIKTLKKMLIGLGVVLILLLTCYFTSSGSSVGNIDGSVVKWSDMIINSSIAMIVVGLITIVFSEVKSLIKS